MFFHFPVSFTDLCREFRSENKDPELWQLIDRGDLEGVTKHLCTPRLSLTPLQEKALNLVPDGDKFVEGVKQDRLLEELIQLLRANPSYLSSADNNSVGS